MPIATLTEQLTLHARTPSLKVFDSRGLPVQTIAYRRSDAFTLARALHTVQVHDCAGRVKAQWDARQYARFLDGRSETANIDRTHSLAGLTVGTRSVDAGWRLQLSDSAGLVRETWDSRGTHTSHEYDPLQRLLSLAEHPAQGSRSITERFTYAASGTADAARNRCGRLIRHDDTAGSIAVDGYHLDGSINQQTRRLLSALDTPQWPQALPERDALLQTGPGYRSTTVQDATGQTLCEVDGLGYRREHRYDIAGARIATHLRTPDGTCLPLILATEFDAQGKMRLQTAGNGVLSTREYSDISGRLLRLHSQRSSSDVLQDVHYDYDPAGNILSQRDAAQPVRHFANQRTEPISHYAYDSLYQLLKASGQETARPSSGPALPGLQPLPSDPNQRVNYNQTFIYDDAGNLERLVHVGGASFTQRMACAAGSNRSLAEHGGQLPGEAELAAAFDACGNLKQLQPGQALQWDVRNRLRSVTPVVREDADNDTEYYVYASDGTRVRKVATVRTQAGVQRREVCYLPGLELHSDSHSGERLQVIDCGNGTRLLHWQAGKPEAIENDQLRYTRVDPLGSSTLELDAAGRLLSHEAYYPYGGTAWWAGRSALQAKYKTVRYSGKERDATGLYYYGARYYAPWLQRWICPDPGGDIDGLNLYRMVSNNPINLRDSQGMAGTDSDLSVEQLNKTINTRIHRFEKVLSDKERAARNVVKGIENEERPHLKRARAVGRAAVIGVGAAAGYAGGGIAGAAFGSWGGPPGMVAGMVAGTLVLGEAFAQATGKAADQLGLGAPLNIMSHAFDYDYDSHEQRDFKSRPARFKENLRGRLPNTEVQWADAAKDITERALPFAEVVTQGYVVASVVPSAVVLGVELIKGPKSDAKLDYLINQAKVLTGCVKCDFDEIQGLLSKDGAVYPNVNSQFSALPAAKSLDALANRTTQLTTQIQTTRQRLIDHRANRSAR